LRTRQQKRRLARWWYERYNRQLERCGCATLWMEPSGFGVGVKALNALRRNEVVASPIDLSHSKDNAIVDFLGVPAPFPRGLATLAKASGAPLVSFFVHRDTGGRLVAEIDEPFFVTDVDAAVQQSATRLEQHVRRHPADWSPWHVFDQWHTLRAPGAPSLAEPASPAAVDASAPIP
jgi:lauroyl/myristoyl acyltransferase